MKISVVIPVYNVEKYLPRCLNSVCAQDESVGEIILINDGSTDGSLEICKEYAQKDGRVKVIDKTNGGTMSAIMAGVNAATGEFVGFVDSDDYIETDMFRIMLDNLEKTGADVAICDYKSFYESGDATAEWERGSGDVEVFDKIDGKFDLMLLPSLEKFRYLPGYRWNKVVRRELMLKNVGFEDKRIRVGEDTALMVPVLFAAEKVVHVHMNLYHYFQRAGSLVHSYSRDYFNDWLKVIEILGRAAEEYGYRIDNLLSCELAELYASCFHKLRNSDLTYRERKEEIKFLGERDEVKSRLKAYKFSTFKSHQTLTMKLLKLKAYGLLARFIKFKAKKIKH